MYIYNNRSACGNVPLRVHRYAGLARKFSLDGGVCVCSAGALQIRVPIRRFCLLKYSNDSKRYPKLPTWNQKGAKMGQGIFKNIPCGTGLKK